MRDIFTATPNLLGLEASEALSVTEYLRSNLGLAGEGEVAAALVGCPAMLMYNVQENLAKKVVIEIQRANIKCNMKMMKVVMIMIILMILGSEEIEVC